MRSEPLAFPHRFADVNEFYWLWIAATTAYGVGDTVTTLAIIRHAPSLVEGNPLVSAAVGAFGLWGLVAWKLVVFVGCLAYSLRAARAWRDTWNYYLPPAVLCLLGTGVTAYNLWLLAQ